MIEGADLRAPWTLRGEAVLTMVRGWRADGGPGALGPVPAGLRPLPGPAVVLVERFAESPAGPFVALSVGRPARLGLRPGVCFTLMVVNQHDRLVAGRLNWGYPGEMGELTWEVTAEGGAVVRWPERDVVIEVERRSKPAIPGVLPIRTLQRRADGPVVVPARFWGRLQRASAHISTAGSDPLGAVAGEHAAVWVEGLRCSLRPARHPRGLLSSLPAPLRAPEPGWSYRHLGVDIAAGSRRQRVTPSGAGWMA